MRKDSWTDRTLIDGEGVGEEKNVMEEAEGAKLMVGGKVGAAEGIAEGTTEGIAEGVAEGLIDGLNEAIAAVHELY